MSYNKYYYSTREQVEKLSFQILLWKDNELLFWR